MERFERIPHGRYINFVADVLKADKTATRAEAIAAWKALKELDVPKDYVSWVEAQGKETQSCISGGNGRACTRVDTADRIDA